MSDRKLMEPRDPERLKRKNLVVLVVLGYPLVLWSVPVPLNLLSELVIRMLGRQSLYDTLMTSMLAVAVPLAMFALAVRAARAGAPTALRWIGLGYAVLFFSLAIHATMNEAATLMQAIDYNDSTAILLLLAGAAWWLGFARFLRRKGTVVAADQDGES